MSDASAPLDNEDVDDIFAALTGDLAEEFEAQNQQRWFGRGEFGSVTVSIPAQWHPILASLVTQLAETLDEDGLVTANLYPLAHPDDLVAQAAFADATRDRLRDGRIAACVTVLAPIEASVLDAEVADAWLRTLNAIRVVVATGVQEDEELEELYESGTPQAKCLMLASAVLGELMNAMT